MRALWGGTGRPWMARNGLELWELSQVSEAATGSQGPLKIS